MNKWLGLMLGVTLPLSAAAQTDPIPVHLLAVGGDGQTVVVNEVLDEPFTVQVLHAEDGTPMPDVALAMWVNFEVCIPSPFPCGPPEGTYGDFVGQDPEEGVTVVTDEDGLAVGPPFRAGSVAGTYSVAASLKPPADQPGGQEYSGQPPNLLATFQIVQVTGQSPAPIAVPGPGSLALMLLVLGMIAIAAMRNWMRRRA